MSAVPALHDRPAPHRPACYRACPAGAWSPERVAARLDEAAATLRDLRMTDERAALGHLRSAWPEPGRAPSPGPPCGG